MKKLIHAIGRWWSDVSGRRKYLRHMEKKDRARRLGAQFLTLITIIAGIDYLIWHWLHINWEPWYYAPLFFAAEAVGFLLFCFFSLNAWFLRYHAPEGIVPSTPFSLDVFIPVAGEPIEIVEKTVQAAVQIDFENKKVYILDDRNDQATKAIAERYGCGYLARPEHKNAKAGNLNYALARTNGDLILALDADQVARPEIIRKTIGYFELPKIAFVQTKQDFLVPVGDPFGNSDRIFYNVMESGKDNDNSAFSCGSGVVYRRKALEEVGGFSTWNIVEDVHTSMRLQEKGWRSVYYNYPLTKGTAPADIYGVYRQRKQWAADSLRILFWDNPFGHKGLTFKQKLQYAHLGFVYIVAAFVMPFFYITPVVAILSNEFVLTAPVSNYVIHRFPYFIAMAFAYGLINYPTPYLRAFQMWTGLFPVFIQATFIALFHRKSKPVYRVNTKPVQKQRQKKSPWLAITPQLAIIVLGLFAVVYGLVVDYEIQWDFYLLNVVWIIWSVWTMSGICVAAVKKTKWEEEAEEADATIVEPARLRFYPVREIVGTIVLSAIVTVFFVTANPVVVQRHLTNVRENVASVMGFRPIAHKSEPQAQQGGTNQQPADAQKPAEPVRQ